MSTIRFDENEFTKLKSLLSSYEWAQRTMLTKLSIIQDSYKHDGSSPIGYVASRIKSPESIAGKLHKQGFAITASNAKKHLKDIAGIRIICPYARDITILANLIREMPEMRILSEKDYVTNPKPSGYRSYHMILQVPIYYSGITEKIDIEIQIRTEGMNFWATLEHQAKYKYAGELPPHLSNELIICADKIFELDSRMFLIHEIISLINDDM